MFDTTQVSEKPYAVSGPELQYPDELRQRGIQGRVVVAVVINADGIPDLRSIRILRSDHMDFEQEALRWVRGALFWPGCRDGGAVRVAIPIDFRITG